MANSLCFSPTCSLQSPKNPGLAIDRSLARKVVFVRDVLRNSRTRTAKTQSFEVKAMDNNQSTKKNSILCPDCEGNGAVACSQCKGSGVNSVDHFNGQFKAGAICWLCRGKREILCGNCNGAGFMGGFLSTFDE
ncbi:PREDICTED: uncharacterized protein LOC104815279 [Tarenaya hassleriana]|uniref:uncharacterized protein LOC104815279 n=1 Tax=Tarenaya hassleriana TaxID=28532 RepID=UPI00053C4501|nr:PREDICTED: uncharacterized protein LOC104815279 [Tarenaya hassleriana]